MIHILEFPWVLDVGLFRESSLSLPSPAPLVYMGPRVPSAGRTQPHIQSE